MGGAGKLAEAAAEAGQEFYCAGHPTRVFCAPVLTAQMAAPLFRMHDFPRKMRVGR
jgi:hypothetical protein